MPLTHNQAKFILLEHGLLARADLEVQAFEAEHFRSLDGQEQK